MALVLADGQLAASVGTILGADSKGAERTVAVLLYNTSRVVEQEVALTLLRSGSTARNVARAKLKGREQLHVTGLPMDPSDVLQGVADSGATVDYLVMLGPGSFLVFARDENGVPKASAGLTVTLPDSLDINQGIMTLIGLGEEIKELLLKIA